MNERPCHGSGPNNCYYLDLRGFGTQSSTGLGLRWGSDQTKHNPEQENSQNTTMLGDNGLGNIAAVSAKNGSVYDDKWLACNDDGDDGGDF